MPEELDLTEEQVVVNPITAHEAEPIASGYVQIRLKGTEGNGIIVKANQVGKTYTTEKWEVIATKKK